MGLPGHLTNNRGNTMKNIMIIGAAALALAFFGC